MSEIRQTCGSHTPNVTSTEYRNVHKAHADIFIRLLLSSRVLKKTPFTLRLAQGERWND
jgi:hypothetical protein